MQVPRCQVDSVDLKLCGREMHFEVSGGRHITQTRSDAGASLGAFGFN